MIRAEHHQDGGFTIVEVMIALLIGMIVMLGVFNVYLGNDASRGMVSMLSEVQGDGRIALKWLKHDLRLAGSVGQTSDPARVRATTMPTMMPTVGDDCFGAGSPLSDWGLILLPNSIGDRAPPVYGLDDVDGSDELFAGCIDADEYVTGSDVLSIHYADPEPTAESALLSGGHYLHSGLGGAVLFRCAVNGQTCHDSLADGRDDPSGARHHRMISHVYFVRTWHLEPDDGISSLMRATLRDDGNVVQELLLDGVADLQVNYGLDSDGDGDVDQYRDAGDLPPLSASSTTLAEWRQIVSVNVSLLLQSVDVYRLDDGATQSFTVGEHVTDVESGHIGKVFSTTVTLRNSRSRAF